MSRPEQKLPVYGAALFAFGWYSFFRGFKKLRKKRIIENTPSSKIRSLPMGLVEVHGIARAKYRLKTPFSDLDCVYFTYKIEEYRSSGKRSRWATLEQGNSSSVEFILEDETGFLTINPDGSEVFCPQQNTLSNQWFGSLPPQAEAYLAAKGHSIRSWLGLSKTLRCTENYILPGDDIFVLGTAQSTLEESMGSRKDLVIQRLRELKKDPALLKQYDLNRDGALSAEEWDYARRLVEQTVVADLTQTTAETFIAKYRDEDFIISDHSEKDLLSKMRLQIILGIYGGPVLAAIGAGMVLAGFHSF